MFEALSKGFREAQNRLAGLTELTPANIQAALREVRLSLLNADVELGVVKSFLARVEEKALGSTVQTRVRQSGKTHRVAAGEQFIKTCHDELVAMMSHEGEPITEADSGPTGVMMVGLQGSGKTTTSAKLARWFQKAGKKPLLVAADMQRPAAVEQLRVLGKQIDIPVFNIEGETPVRICEQARAEAKKLGRDVIIYDTAGRLAIDETLMLELAAIKTAVQPENILLVVDAMIGQDAVKTAKGFNERLGITGAVLTKLDGDARGGAALSIKEVTGAPLLFVGMGETTDKFEPFRAEGMASRVLGMGDVVGLVKDFEGVVDQRDAEKQAARLLEGQFSFDDFLNQIRMIQKMGSLKDIMEKMPGLSQMMPPGAPTEIDDKELGRIEAMIQSMTRAERDDPHMLVREPSRARRISRGSGTTEQGVQELVQKFLFMREMLGGMSGGGGGGGFLNKLMGGIPGLNLARNMRRAIKSGKVPNPFEGGGMPQMPPGMGLPGMPGMFPGAAGGALGANTPARPRVISKTERNSRKADRKRERDARKKSKGKK